jgi:hypothetical protein
VIDGKQVVVEFAKEGPRKSFILNNEIPLRKKENDTTIKNRLSEKVSSNFLTKENKGLQLQSLSKERV